MNGRGDSQQHHEYAQRLFGWPLGRWTHAVTPMADPYPPDGQRQAYYSDAFPWGGKIRDYQVATPDGVELDWGWEGAHNRGAPTGRPEAGVLLRRFPVGGEDPRLPGRHAGRRRARLGLEGGLQPGALHGPPVLLLPLRRRVAPRDSGRRGAHERPRRGDPVLPPRRAVPA